MEERNISPNGALYVILMSGYIGCCELQEAERLFGSSGKGMHAKCCRI